MKILLFVFSLLILNCHFALCQSYLDSTFGVNGIVITPMGSVSNNAFYAIATQPDHKILAAGFATGMGIVIRYNEDGTPDISFGTSGIFINAAVWGNAMVLQPDGKILMAGGGAICRLNPDGNLDTTFGKAGIDSTLVFWPGLGWNAIALQTDGKIVLAGDAYSTSIGVGRILSDGNPDSSFGINGMVVTSGWSSWAFGKGRGLGIMTDGRIVVGGESSRGFITIRMLADGTPDTSFNHTGVVTNHAGSGYNYCHAMQLQPDGKPVLAGNGGFGITGSDFVAIRYNISGTLDGTFGDTGVAHIDFNQNDDEASALYRMQNGKILVAGFGTNTIDPDFAITRIDSNGKIDSAFGNNGRIVTSIQNGNDIPKSIGLQYDDKIVLAGWSFNSAISHDEMTVVRYGSQTPSFVKYQYPGFIEEMNLYPNPSHGNIKFDKKYLSHISMVSVFDIFGKEVTIQYGKQENEIVINKLSDGVYLLKICLDNAPLLIQKILIRNSQ